MTLQKNQNEFWERGSDKKWPKVSIIILNWNSWRDTIECLESIQKVDYANLEVIVIDNASKDESIEKILSWCSQNKIWHQQLIQKPSSINIGADAKPIMHNDSSCCGSIQQLLLIKVSKNVGFCIGNNIGMKQAAINGAEFILVLNNDTIVEPTFLKPMVEVAQQEENIGLVGGVICYAENPDLIWFAGGSFDKYLESKRLLDGEHYSSVASNRILDTDWVSGCMTLIPRKVYNQLGGYFEGFFIWSEEWDYSLRAKKAGYRLAIAPRGRIFHKVGRSLGIMKPLAYYYGTRNRLMLKGMYLTRSLRWSFLAFFLISRIPRYAHFALGGRWDLVEAGSCGILDYFLGRTGKWVNHAD